MIGILFIEKQPIPVLVCDFCNKVITDVSEGVVTFPSEESLDKLVSVQYVHRKDCIQKLTHGNPSFSWQNLGKHFECLCQNTKGLAPQMPQETESTEEDMREDFS